jgi:hypothetical protein
MSITHDNERDADGIVSALAELQLLALAFSRSSTAIELGRTLRVAFVVDATYPWRLIETERSATGRVRLSRMLCFGSLEEIRRAAGERLSWTAADEQFRATQMATPGGFPGVTADWVHSRDFDLIFAPLRHSLRERICATPSAQTLILR